MGGVNTPLVAGDVEKVGPSRAGSGSGRRAVKSAEHTEISRRQTANQRPCDLSGRRHADQQTNTISSRHTSGMSDDESSYYTQRVAPVIDEMSGYVSGHSMTLHHVHWFI